MASAALPRIDVRPLFPELESRLLQLLDGLSPDDWKRPTVCRGWAVHDVAAHLLDGALRRLAAQRDGHLPPAPDLDLTEYSALVGFLNQLNAEWVQAARRLSPRILRDLVELSSAQLIELFGQLDPEAPAQFPVTWAGEDTSQSWFDLAREFTERWHHQQQIRDAVGAEPLSQRRFLHPVLDTFMRGLPHHYRRLRRPPGAALGIEIHGEAGGRWGLVRSEDGWRLRLGRPSTPLAEVALGADLAWRIFTNAARSPQELSPVVLRGDRELAEAFLSARSVMV